MLCKAPRRYPNAPEGLLPCGSCQPCKINRRRDWTTRLILEANAHDHNLWITLTYADEFLPKGKVRSNSYNLYGSHNFPTLYRPDYQDFFKRLRSYKHIPDFKYFVAGEYGDKFGRPHYHACLFGLSNSHRHLIRRAWSLRIAGRGVVPIGHVYFGDLNWDTCQYTAGYTVKKMTSFKHEELNGRYPEFGEPSKGLSLDAAESIVSIIRRQRLNSIPPYLTLNGKKVPIPRYVKKKIRKELGISDEQAQAEWKAEMFDMRCRLKNSPEAFSLEQLYQEENYQELLNQSAKLRIFKEKEKLQ